MITSKQIRAIMPAAGGNAEAYAEPLATAMERFGIITTARIAPFLANVAVESGQLSAMEERLNYSAAGLMATWPSHFDSITAAEYAHNPQKIANRAYAGRNGNGNEASGDGYRFRGRGPFQITGRANYDTCGKGISYDLLNNPTVLTIPGPAALSAAWFWSSHGLNELADAGDFKSIVHRINGGENGMADRLTFLADAKRVLGAK